MIDELIVQTVPVGMLSTNCYILSLPGRDDCVVIDPGAEADKIRAAIGEKKLAAVLLTHGHFDHIGAATELAVDGVPLMIHEDDAEWLGDPEKNVSAAVDTPLTCRPADRLLHEGDTLALAGMTIRVLHTPGHTPGGACYETGTHLFTGDTMFINGYGRTDFPGGSMKELIASLRRLYPMREDHRIHGGHG